MTNNTAADNTETQTPKPKKKKPFSLKAIDVEIIKQVYFFRALYVPQIAKLTGLKENSSSKYIYRRLSALAQEGFLTRTFKAKEKGRPVSLYLLSSKGAQLLERQVLKHDIEWSAQQDKLLFHSQHNMDVADFAIDCIVKKPQNIAEVEFASELLSTHPYQNSDGKEVLLRPDGLLSLHDKAGRSMWLFFEREASSQLAYIWHNRVNKWKKYEESDTFYNHYHATSFRVLVLANNLSKMKRLQRITKETTEHHSLFLFTHMGLLQTHSPYDSVWYHGADAEHPKGLL